jgi:ABC-type cobalamin/Fe3+-siderophores transport system ATPase subunit
MVWSLTNRTSIHTAKYADEVILLAKGETVLQGMADRLVEAG